VYEVKTSIPKHPFQIIPTNLSPPSLFLHIKLSILRLPFIPRRDLPMQLKNPLVDASRHDDPMHINALLFTDNAIDRLFLDFN
jgi:hypothetical protein